MASFTGTNLPNDTTGGAGADTLLGASGAATNPGANTIEDADTLSGAGGNDVIFGGAGADSLFGNQGNDTISGGNEGDTISGGTGADSLDGGDGLDVLNYRGDFSGVSVNLALGIATGGDAQGDAISGFEALFGGSGNDSLTGNVTATTLDGGDGADSIQGLVGNDGILGGAGDDTVDGGEGNDTIGGGVGADSLVGGGGDDLVVVGTGGSDTADGGADIDTMAFDLGGTVTIAGSAADFTYTLPGGDGGIGRNFEFLRDVQGNLVAVGDVLAGGGTLAVCFAEGTRILTSAGEVAVERLRAGDLVATLAGAAPLQPVLWVGRRRIVLAGHPQAADLAPIRIRAGALAEATPHRDLLVSPDHCLFLDGVLVPARLLVNGTSIAAERGLPEVTYLHVELEGHAVLLANGAAAESWLDAGNRAWFANAPAALLRVAALPDAYARAAGEPCAPVLHGGPRLAAIRDAIALRATQTEPLRRARA